MTARLVRVESAPVGARRAELWTGDPWERVDLLLSKARADLDNPSVQALASMFARKLPSGDLFGPALQAWVQANVSYVDEKKETFRGPAVVWAQRIGDCDCQARFVASIAAGGGHTSELVIFARPGLLGIEPYHVAPIVDGCWCETTVRAWWDEYPIAAGRRCIGKGHARESL